MVPRKRAKIMGYFVLTILWVFSVPEINIFKDIRNLMEILLIIQYFLLFDRTLSE